LKFLVVLTVIVLGVGTYVVIKLAIDDDPAYCQERDVQDMFTNCAVKR
jgi:hypothetical protein